MEIGKRKANQNPHRRVILASSSPRRKELLNELIPSFEVISSDADEIEFHEKGPVFLVEDNAKIKASSVARQFPQHWVLGADTLVFCAERVLGKPQNLEEAIEMLLFLSGKTHQVATGVSLQCLDIEKEYTFSEISDVTFKQLSEDIIKEYYLDVDPLDKAGGYAIQARADLIVEKFAGSYSNVVGLPIESLREKFDYFSIIQL